MKTHPQRVALIGAMLLSAATLNAGPFQGFTSGIFWDPEGPAFPDFVEGIGTDTLTWGTPQSSMLRFEGTAFVANDLVPFRVGELKYQHGLSTPDSELNLVRLRLTLAPFESEPSHMFPFTLNIGPDFIELIDPVYVEIYPPPPMLHVVFGDVTGVGSVVGNKFYLSEGNTATVELITAIPDSGLTLAFLGATLAGIGLLSPRVKQRANRLKAATFRP